MAKSSQIIVGIFGPIGSGKSTVARHLIKNHMFHCYSFAEPMRKMLGALLDYAGEDPSLVYNLDKKETPLEVLEGRSIRYGLQTLGTDWGRDLIGENLWINLWRRSLQGSPRVVVDDLRHPNEATMIQNLGGKIIKIQRLGTQAPIHTHSSEAFLDILPFDFEVYNSGTLDQLFGVVDRSLGL